MSIPPAGTGAGAKAATGVLPGLLEPPLDDRFERLGIDVAALSVGRGKNTRVLCRPCLDWSERRPHLAGALGAALCARSFEENWIRRSQSSRAVTVTVKGWCIFRDTIGVRLDEP